MHNPELKVFSGRAHPALTQEICTRLGEEPGHVTLYSFSDGENYVQIDENVRGADVFVMQPTSPPVNDNLFQMGKRPATIPGDRNTWCFPAFGPFE